MLRGKERKKEQVAKLNRVKEDLHTLKINCKKKEQQEKQAKE